MHSERVEVPPSAYGFVSVFVLTHCHNMFLNSIQYLQRSILPKTRADRLAMKDKVALERNRINNRYGWEARMHQQNAPETSALLTSCPTGAAGYLSNADRFHTDVVGEEYAVRQEKIKKQQAAMDFKRNAVSTSSNVPAVDCFITNLSSHRLPNAILIDGMRCKKKLEKKRNTTTSFVRKDPKRKRTRQMSRMTFSHCSIIKTKLASIKNMLMIWVRFLYFDLNRHTLPH